MAAERLGQYKKREGRVCISQTRPSLFGSHQVRFLGDTTTIAWVVAGQNRRVPRTQPSHVTGIGIEPITL